ncbi:SapB/AmfS family lanthipeptide [Kitasatospora xanthocidica]|nr:SapB/AmfS family lanthipeptide [Kitasatospora xanthocidica]
MALLDLQTMELPAEAEDLAPMGSGQSTDCSNSSWLWCN